MTVYLLLDCHIRCDSRCVCLFSGVSQTPILINPAFLDDDSLVHNQLLGHFIKVYKNDHFFVC